MRRGVIDRFLNGIFYFSKALSAVMVALSCVVILGLTLKLVFVGGGSVKVPKFKELRKNLETRSEGKASYFLLDQKREIEKRYGDEISKLVKEFHFTPRGYDILIEDLMELPPKYRDTFVEGLRNYLRDARKYIKKKGKEAEIDVAQAADTYRKLFRKRVEEVEARKAQASLQRKYILVALAGTLMVMLAFLVLPLLIRIEENTRPKPY